MLSGIAGYVAGGFVAGAIWCIGCEGKPFGRLFIAVIGGILSIIFAGFPPANEGGVGPPNNAWPYIAMCWIVFFLGWSAIAAVRVRK